ncbi:hypothetical protein SAMN04488490_1811 [Marinobacter sp. LV10R510-11A]|uniref:hypothetical protein n=1 Tax=Marinobacter sp. LV10R510-11A TaxID=1415568 RepID=UPI000BB6C398|nr:hypothetical protein [Marinobacter sp. LV10R510-11A]SOB76135.1 hypothetical protein SAMN04488490_1811 [Marinobacter sp. LV10R510-11A]
MAMTDAERKRRQRERLKALDVRPFQMELAANERKAIEEAAQGRGFEDQTEYLLALVYKDRDMSRKENVCSYPKCNCPFDKPEGAACYRGRTEQEAGEA